MQVKPPYFQECPNCHKEFGSRSLKIHAERCKSKVNNGSSSDPDTPETQDLKTSRQKGRLLPLQPSLSLTDDEIETSLSDELSALWPAKRPYESQPAKAVKKTKRRRERKRASPSTSLSERPNTATLPKPNILDESLKDKVDMTLTKKGLLAAVKLCSDVVVQRGLPNMRPRPPNRCFVTRPRREGGKAKNSVGMIRVGKNKNHDTTSGSSTSVSPYMNQKKIKERPVTSHLERPSRDGLELPHIHVRSQNFYEKGRTGQISHPISTRLSRRYKSKQRRGSSNDNKNRSPPRTFLDADVINANIKKTMSEIKMFKRSNNPSFTILRLAKAKLESKDRVPEPCRSCGRDDLPERLHTHRGNGEEKKDEPKPKLNSPLKKVETLDKHPNKSEPRPWISPSSRPRRNERSMSFDLQLSPLLSTRTMNKANPENNRPASTTTIKVIEISDENEATDGQSVMDVIVSEVKKEETANREVQEASVAVSAGFKLVRNDVVKTSNHYPQPRQSVLYDAVWNNFVTKAMENNLGNHCDGGRPVIYDY